MNFFFGLHSPVTTNKYWLRVRDK